MFNQNNSNFYKYLYNLKQTRLRSFDIASETTTTGTRAMITSIKNITTRRKIALIRAIVVTTVVAVVGTSILVVVVDLSASVVPGRIIDIVITNVTVIVFQSGIVIIFVFFHGWLV